MNNFKSYSNKRSTLKKYSRFAQGGTVDIFKKRLGWWEKFIINKNNADDIIFEVTSKFSNRADRISYELYGRADLDWLILQYNNIIDINEELTVGKILKAPSKNRVFYELTINNLERG